MFRSLALTLALAASAAVAPAATHLFVPGHGLTDRSGPNKTIIQLRDECVNTGQWMRFIEKQYEWGSLENDLPVGTSNAIKDNPTSAQRKWNQGGLDRIRLDAEECGKAGLVLRVVILHKYGSYPGYMTEGGTESRRHTYTFQAGQGTGATNYEIQLDQDKTKNLLLGLYDKVIAELKKNNNSRKGFYGFVIQETSLGTSGLYENDAGKQAKWYKNLRAFHDSLHTKLADFNSAGTTSPVTPPGRLFWQMINSPYPEVKKIVDNFNGVDGIDNETGNNPVLPGAGLCGPDTFPREPVNHRDVQPVPGSRTTLYKCYDEFMRNRTDRPISLRVASSNYYTDRAHFSETVKIGVQRIWTPSTSNLGSSNGWNSPGNTNDTAGISYVGQGNRDAGDGIANFVGCANDSNSPDNLNLHNVVWTWSSGTLIEYVEDLDPNTPGIQDDLDPNTPGRQRPSNEADQGQPWGNWGWNEVKAWMKDDVRNQFPQTTTGGCNPRATGIGAF